MEEEVPTIEDEEIVQPVEATIPAEEDEVPVLEDPDEGLEAEPEAIDEGADETLATITQAVSSIPDVTPPQAEVPKPAEIPDIPTLEVYQHRGIDFPVSADGDSLDDARFEPGTEESEAFAEWLAEEYGERAQQYYLHYYQAYQQAQAAYEAKRSTDYVTLASAGYKNIEPAQAATRAAILAELDGDKPLAEKVYSTYEPKAAELIQSQRTGLMEWYQEQGFSPAMAKAKADAAIFSIPNLWDRAITESIVTDRANFIKTIKAGAASVAPPAAQPQPAKPPAARPPVPPMGTGSGGSGGAKPDLYLLPREKAIAAQLGITDLKAYAAKCRAGDRTKG